MLPFKWYIAGTGNMGMALGELLKSSDNLTFCGWLSQTPSEKKQSPVFSIDNHIDKDAGVFLCIPDRFIASAADTLKRKFSSVIHCSGTQPLHKSCDAVCWPMQTFSLQVPPVWKDVPVFIESRYPDLEGFLTSLFEIAGSSPKVCTQEQRQNAHLAAVIANNFSNALFMFASKVLTEKGLSPDLLLPIIKQTVEKLRYTNLQNAQTGPAIREDADTLSLHLELLKKKPEMQHLYHEISAIIPILFKK
jgi:predicted short-subunit dehydrogenase-like oxidoreductase (DUF2520 family)